MYPTSGGFHSHFPGLFQEDQHGRFVWAAHPSDGSPSGSTPVPSREDIQTQSQGNYGETPEHSPRGSYRQESLPQHESPTARSPESIGSERPVSVVMTTPVTGCYMQMPVVFMMIPMIGSQHDADSQAETSPSRSAYSLHENYGNEEETMQFQTAHDLPQPSPSGVAAASREVPAGFTTLVIRNVPARYKPDMLLEEFGADGSFDLFFLPYSFRDAKTMGVAFINFRSHGLAVRFQDKWQRMFLRDHGRTKHLDIAAATYQGLVQNLKQFNPKNIARLESAGMLPMFFDSSGNRLSSVQELKRYGVLPVAF